LLGGAEMPDRGDPVISGEGSRTSIGCRASPVEGNAG
jgi:hypothetical protein